MSEFLEEPIQITSQRWDKNTIPIVSISCITYNHEKYIRDAIEGFLMQKTTFPVEILIHDDASTDKTASIVREYEKKYPHIIKPIYQTENKYSTQRGYITRIQNERTKGKYVAKCEGDDYWIDPYKLQKQVEFLEENRGYSMCFHNAIVIETNRSGRLAYLFNDYTSCCDLTINDIVDKWVVPTASIVFRKEYLELPLWMESIYSGDFSLLLYLFTEGKIRYLDCISSFYRKDFSGKSVSVNINTNFVRSQHIKLLESFNKGTNHKYESVINKRVNFLKKEISLRKAIYNKKYYKLFLLIPNIWINLLRYKNSKLKK